MYVYVYVYVILINIIYGTKRGNCKAIKLGKPITSKHEARHNSMDVPKFPNVNGDNPLDVTSPLWYPR